MAKDARCSFELRVAGVFTEVRLTIGMWGPVDVKLSLSAEIELGNNSKSLSRSKVVSTVI